MNVTCTHCGQKLDLSKTTEVNAHIEALAERNKQKLSNEYEKEYQQKLLIEKSKQEEALRASLSQQHESQLVEIQRQSQLQLAQMAEQQKLSIEKVKQEEALRASLSQQHESQLAEIQRQSQLQLAQMAEQNKQLNTQIDVLKRKAMQGSVQVQGEVQELEIESWLTEAFPLDTITEIKKGAKGADCLQVINTREREACATIYYESKRTKAFQPAWIKKFKSDIREKNANVGVLVTEVMPSGASSVVQLDGIWVCQFDQFKMVAMVLRESLLTITQAIKKQENISDKTSLLYEYFTSDQFKNMVDIIFEEFDQLKTNIDQEKKLMLNSWNKRENSLDQIIRSTVSVYSTLESITNGDINVLSDGEITKSITENKN